MNKNILFVGKFFAFGFMFKEYKNTENPEDWGLDMFTRDGNKYILTLPQIARQTLSLTAIKKEMKIQNNNALKGDFVAIDFVNKANEFLKVNGLNNTRFSFDIYTGNICVIENDFITAKFDV